MTLDTTQQAGALTWQQIEDWGAEFVRLTSRWRDLKTSELRLDAAAAARELAKLGGS